MRILGIDPGTGIVGFGVIDTDGHNHNMIEAGVIRTPAHQALELRLKTIYDSLLEIMKDNNPDTVVIEILFLHDGILDKSLSICCSISL